ncbi:hypothetical protein ACFLRC_03150 [Candidatus Altiarchaeota archaeon]
MKKFRRLKGQAAMEYLMTYGWAVLVVMIVGVVMWQMGIFNMGSTTITAQGFSRVKPQLAATGLRENGDFTIIFMNGAGTDLVWYGGTLALQAGANNFSCAIAPTQGSTIQVGANFQVTGSCGDIGVGPGEVFSGDITMRYGIRIGNIQSDHADYGKIRGPIEP